MILLTPLLTSSDSGPTHADVGRLNAILVWRFMLNLQETRWRTEEDLTTIVGTPRANSTLLFDRVVGSIGESLQFGPGAVETEIGTRECEGELTGDS